MKLVMINGSPRTNGATAQIMRVIQKRLLEKEDVEIDFYNLSELELSYCNGCCSCFKTGKCVMNDDLEKLTQAVVLADSVIIGSPTYASNLSGQLKTFIDRGHLIIEQALYKKYGLGIVTSENYGASTAAGVLKNVFSFSGGYVTAMIKHKLPFSHSPQLALKATRRFEKTADRLYKDIKVKRHYLLQKIVHRVIFHLGIKPFVIKKGSKYAGVLKSWQNSSLLS